MLTGRSDTVMRMHTSDRIRALRKQKDWSQKELGDRAGVSKQAVSQWEVGSTKGLKPEHLIAVADVLGVSARYLVTGENPTHQPQALAKERVIDAPVMADILARVRELWGALPDDNHELAGILADGYTRTMHIVREKGRDEVRAIMAYAYDEYRLTHDGKSEREKGDE